MDTNSEYYLRFSGIERLYGPGSLEKLLSSNVAVVGVGGVGSWSAEALARSGIGKLTLIDLDDVCITNTNRQIHALNDSIGQPKVEVLKKRLLLINPEIHIESVCDFYTQASSETILTHSKFDYLIDAIDSLQNKTRLIKHCKQLSIPIVSVGGAGGRRDPSKVTSSDLKDSTNDGLLRRVRKALRKSDFPESEQGFGVACVYSRENPIYPGENGCLLRKASQASSTKLDCSSGYGTTSFVTGTFGFMAAKLALDHLVGNLNEIQDSHV